MVFFTCNACGESLKKAQVEKHYLHKCRQCEVLTCVDCHKVWFMKFVGKVFFLTFLFHIRRIFPEIRIEITQNAFQKKRSIVQKAGNPKQMPIKVPKSRKSGYWDWTLWRRTNQTELMKTSDMFYSQFKDMKIFHENVQSSLIFAKTLWEISFIQPQ